MEEEIILKNRINLISAFIGLIIVIAILIFGVYIGIKIINYSEQFYFYEVNNTTGHSTNCYVSEESEKFYCDVPIRVEYFKREKKHD